MNENIAEFYGALIGDGCLSRYKVKGRNKPRDVILLTGHLTNDIDYYRNVIRKIIKLEFSVSGYLYERKKYNCIRFVIFSRDAFDLFESMNFPIGRKTQLFIHDSILKDNNLALACIRGIFNTDGTVYRRYSKKYKNHPRLYNYAVVQFKLNSKKTLEQIKDILTTNNIKTTKIGKDNKSHVLRITDQDHIEEFMKLVRPSNNYHIERFLNITNSCKI